MVLKLSESPSIVNWMEALESVDFWYPTLFSACWLSLFLELLLGFCMLIITEVFWRYCSSQDPRNLSERIALALVYISRRSKRMRRIAIPQKQKLLSFEDNWSSISFSYYYFFFDISLWNPSWKSDVIRSWSSTLLTFPFVDGVKIEASVAKAWKSSVTGCRSSEKESFTHRSTDSLSFFRVSCPVQRSNMI